MNLAQEPASSRRDAFVIAADRRGLLLLVIEKDFWVCWTLEQLFALPGFGDHLLFKGGTSLSKVYGIIQRFSEDIDLSLSRNFLGEGLADPEQAKSNTQRKQRSEALVAAFHSAVTERLLPALRNAMSGQLGEENKGEENKGEENEGEENKGEDGWTLIQDGTDPGTLHFAYPRAIAGNLCTSAQKYGSSLVAGATTGLPRTGPSSLMSPRSCHKWFPRSYLSGHWQPAGRSGRKRPFCTQSIIVL